MLCDHAQIEGGKLFISGANIDRVLVAAGAPAPFALVFAVAGLVRVGWTDTNVDHTLSIGLQTPDGDPGPVPGIGPDGSLVEMGFNVGRPPQAAAGDDQLMPFVVPFQPLPVLEPGRLVVVVSVDGEPVRSLPLTVMQQAQQGGHGPASIPNL